MKDLHIVESPEDYCVYFTFNMKMIGANNEVKTAPVRLLLGNLLAINDEEERNVAPVFNFGGGHDPSHIHRGITKFSGSLAFDTISVDWEADFAYLMNKMKKKFNSLTEELKAFVVMVFNKSYILRGEEMPTSITSCKDLSPDDVSFAMIPEFDIEIKTPSKKEKIIGCTLYQRNSSAGVQELGVSTAYGFIFKGKEPLSDL